MGRSQTPQIRVEAECWEEAADISRDLGLQGPNGRSATGGVREILRAAGRFRQETGRTLTPADIDEAAHRVASRRRKGAGNG